MKQALRRTAVRSGWASTKKSDLNLIHQNVFFSINFKVTFSSQTILETLCKKAWRNFMWTAIPNVGHLYSVCGLPGPRRTLHKFLLGHLQVWNLWILSLLVIIATPLAPKLIILNRNQISPISYLTSLWD